MNRIGIKFLSLVIGVSMLFVSCSEDSENAGNPPELPPKASLSANLGTFPQNGDGRVDETQTKTNFAFSAINVGFWQTAIGVVIFIPAKAFEAAFNQDFQYLSDEKRWKSEYTVNVNNQAVTAQLFAKNNGETVSWEMYLSAEGQYEDFLWFTGESRVDNSGGDWVLYGGPSEPREVLRIDWDREGDNFIHSKYVLVDTESAKSGSFVEYGLSTEADFSHYYEIFVVDTQGDDYDAHILYNETSTEGRVKSEAHFGDADWRCWDENQDDIDC
ncbi:MAG: hypothetical protein RIC35_06635 [Marinoscillum sp.]